jgi:glutamate racemase
MSGGEGSGDARPIGVFDSGMGGLTVLRAMEARLPNERFVYLGDTARLPYGTKSPETIAAYALQATRLLLAQGVKMVVIACNTASAVAIEPLAAALAPVPVIGVIEPGAEAGIAATRNGRIAVIATESTVKGNAYARAIQARDRDIAVLQQPCQVFVALAEEGWTDNAPARDAASAYLTPLFAGADAPDTLVLGCTHFPVLSETIRAAVGDGVAIVDSAKTTAEAVAAALKQSGLASDRPPEDGNRLRIFATDSPERFARVGEIFLGRKIDPSEVELVDLAMAEA